MGLDTVELFMNVEEAFDIEIPDEQASQMLTVGDLYAHVRAAAPAICHIPCASAFAFYRLRTALAAAIGCERAQLSPSSSMTALIPHQQRRRVWTEVMNATGWRLPPLSRPPAMVGAMAVAVPAVSLATVLVAELSFRCGVWAFLMMGIGLSLSVHYLTRPFATLVPANDLAALTRDVVTLNAASLRQLRGGVHEAEVWQVLRGIVAHQFSLDPGEVHPGLRWVEDLGC